MGIGSPAMQCHEQGWICLALGHPGVAYPIRNVIARAARRSRFSTVAGKRDCFVASLLAMTIKFRCHQFRKSRAQWYCAEWWDNLSNIRRKAFLFSAYGLLPFCKQIVLLTNQVRLRPYIRLLSGIRLSSFALSLSKSEWASTSSARTANRTVLRPDLRTLTLGFCQAMLTGPKLTPDEFGLN